MPQETPWWDWSGIFDWWNAATNWLTGAAAVLLWETIGKHVVCWLSKAFCALMLLIFNLIVPILLRVLELFPTMPTLVITPIVSTWKLANYYFPLNETVTTATFCIGFVIVWRLIRLIKSLLPGLSS